MSLLLAKMEALNTNLDSKFASLNQKLNSQAEEFRVELGVLRAEMVNEQQFVKLEERVVALESGGVANTQLTWFQNQLNRLDPANESIVRKEKSTLGEVPTLELQNH